jgi:hypothetical protein
MAKGKSSGKQSAGIHSNVSSKIVNAIRTEYLQSGERLLNQLEAHKKGKRVVLTIKNPNNNETNKKFIKVPGSAMLRNPKAI